jgi:alpha-amylase
MLQTTLDCDAEVLDAILDYPSYFQLTNAFLNTQGKFSSVVSVMTQAQQTYKHGLFRTAAFVENHDQPRLASLTKDPGASLSAISGSLVTKVLTQATYSLSVML